MSNNVDVISYVLDLQRLHLLQEAEKKDGTCAEDLFPPSSIIYLFLPIAAASPPVSLICIPLDLNGSLLIDDLLS